MYKRNNSRMIDITPSWRGTVWVHLAIIANKKADIIARAGSVCEIERLAEAVAAHEHEDGEAINAWNIEQLSVLEKLGAKWDAERKRVTDEVYALAEKADKLNAAASKNREAR